MNKLICLLLVFFDLHAHWMQEQINRDLSPYKNAGISKSDLYEKFKTIPPELFLIRFVIKNHTITTEKMFSTSSLDYRIESFTQAFAEVDSRWGLPDVEFYILLHDGYGESYFFGDHLNDFPIFVMSRTHFPGQKVCSIFIPDFENLKSNYQVLENIDVTSYKSLWKKKKNQLVWRGSTAQNVWYNYDPYCIGSPLMNESNCKIFSRYCLCELSQNYPTLIDAKFTHLVDLDPAFALIKYFEGNWLSFEEQFNYKYHILVNGNASPYSASCWKLFTNSLIFIPTSYVFQWYSAAMKPYVHYIPVNENLSDLVKKIQWAQKHDLECERLAKNCRKFAINNLQREHSLQYIHMLLKQYSTYLK